MHSTFTSVRTTRKRIIKRDLFSRRLNSKMESTNKTIYIENFPLDTREALLHKLFSHFGRIKHLELPTFDINHPLNKGLPVPKTKGYAFIEFSSLGEAENAIKFFNDLENILHEPEKDVGDDLKNCQDSKNSLRAKLLNSLEYKSVIKVRVMSKKFYSSVMLRYKEKKQLAIVMAAKRLAIA